jgi:maltokinase
VTDSALDISTLIQSLPDDVGQRVAFVSSRRWFGGRSREITSAVCAVQPWLRDAPGGSTPAVRLETLRIGYADGGSETYLLVTTYSELEIDGHENSLVGRFPAEDGGDLLYAYDAAHVREAATLIIEPIAAGTSAGGMIGHLVLDEIDVTAPPLALPAEQSNTSIVYGDSLLKLFRRVQPGRNPDITAHEAFTREGLTVAPKLLGWAEGSWTDEDGEHTGDIAMVTRFLSSATDGWVQATASMRDLLAEGDLHADEVGGDMAAEMHRLGETTRIMHEGLAHAFGTGKWTGDEVARLADRLRSRLSAAVERVPAIKPYQDAVLATYAALAELPYPVQVQRVHADFHLGQTLRAIAGWKVIDFEGEPGTHYESREGFDSPWRDVAGMLRSIDYAAKHLVIGPHHGPQEQFRAQEWESRNRRAFLAGYAAGSTETDPAGDVLLAAYELDKAVYEVVYEASMRPDWISIPLSALERLS